METTQIVNEQTNSTATLFEASEQVSGSEDGVLATAEKDTAVETDNTLSETVFAAEEDTIASIEISPNAFVESLPVMGKGMLGIFLVTAVIILVITLLNKAGEKAAQRREAKNKAHDAEAATAMDEGSFE